MGKDDAKFEFSHRCCGFSLLLCFGRFRVKSRSMRWINAKPSASIHYPPKVYGSPASFQVGKFWFIIAGGMIYTQSQIGDSSFVIIFSIAFHAV